MANRFGPDILIQAPDPKKAALFYVNHLGFEITDNNPKMISASMASTSTCSSSLARPWDRSWK
jgi:hypothetical protein